MALVSTKFFLLGAIAIAITIASAGIYLFFYEPNHTSLFVIPNHNPFIIGHRGAGNLAPENTLASFRMALEMGLDGVELDMQLSKDKQVVIFHDFDLARVTNGAGAVNEKTLSELKELDVGSKFSDKFVGERIPTFEEVLRLTSGKMILVSELKANTLKSNGLEEIVVEIIRKHDAFDWVVIGSFNPVALWRIKKIEPRITTSFIFRSHNPNNPALTEGIPRLFIQEWVRRGLRKIIKPDFLEPEYNVDPMTLSRLSSRGYPMLFWTVNTEEGLEKILKFNPWGIITDDPNLVVGSIKKGI